jgi:hypothetical protein
MISFEFKGAAMGPEEIEIWIDEDGLSSLLAQLQFLKDGKTEHVHLMSDSWGGNDLSSEPVNPSNRTIHHVKILLRV